MISVTTTAMMPIELFFVSVREYTHVMCYWLYRKINFWDKVV